DLDLPEPEPRRPCGNPRPTRGPHGTQRRTANLVAVELLAGLPCCGRVGRISRPVGALPGAFATSFQVDRRPCVRIAQIAPLTEGIGAKVYGGREGVVDWVTEELVALGHDVTLFASGDSITSAKLDAMWPQSLRLSGSIRDPNALHMLMMEVVRRRADDFDVL